MNSEMIAAIMTSGVALIAAVISLIVGLRTLKIQKKLSNSSLQIEYLKEKFSLLNTLKIELTSLDHNNAGNEISSKSNVINAMANYISELLVLLPKTIEILKGHINNEKLGDFEKRVEKIKKRKASEITNKVFGQATNEIQEFGEEHPIDQILQIKDEFKFFIVEEMVICKNKIEKIIELNVK